MSTQNKKRVFINWDVNAEKERISRKKEAEKALHESFFKAEAGEWEKVISLGLEYPQNMEQIILAYYPVMPEKIKYTLPLTWYMASGKASEAVCNAVKNALQYKPPAWIGKAACKGDILEIYCCVKNGDIETAKDSLSWSMDHGAAYIDAMKINGRIFKGYIKKEDIIAYDEGSCNQVIQFRSVYAVQQLYPVLPIVCLKRKNDLYYGSEQDEYTT